MSNKWVLSHGIHRGTLTSRDIGQPQEFDTREEAIASYAESGTRVSAIKSGSPL